LFGEAPDHLAKHLPDTTRRTLERLRGANGQSLFEEWSTQAKQARSINEKLETFDTGPTFVRFKGSTFSTYEKIELTVDRDDLVGDEDQIELSAHIF
jgi:hypothetical protein